MEDRNLERIIDYVVTKNDWEVFPMPEQNDHFILKKRFNKKQIEKLKLGYLPRGMDDRWFSYFENGKLHIFRSWSGNCIYIVKFNTLWQRHKVIVNRDPNQYSSTDIKEDAEMLESLLDNWSYIG